MTVTAKQRATMTVKEVIDAMGFDRKTVYQWLNASWIPNRKVGGRFVISREQFYQWLNSAPVKERRR